MGSELRKNKELASYQADLQSQENQRQEKWNADEWTRQFGMQEQQWQQHFAQETAWNSEQAKAQRLREVGVNPVAALGGSQGGVVGTSSTGTPSVSPRSGVTSAPAPFASSTPQILNSLNNAIATMGQVGLQDAERNRISKLLEHEINKTIAETDNEREKALMNRLANMMTKQQWPYKIQMGMVELYDKIQDIYVKQSQQKNLDADSFLKDAQTAYTTFLKTHGEKLEPWQVGLAQQEFEWYSKLKAEQIRTMRTQQQLNTANANQANESARGMKLLNDINYENKHILVAEMQQEWTNMVNAGIITEQQAHQAGLTTSILKYAEDHKELDYWKAFVIDLLKSGGDIVSAYANLKTAGAWQSLNDTQRRNVEAKIEELRRHANDTNVKFYWDEKHGVFRPKEADANVPNVDNSWLQFDKK